MMHRPINVRSGLHVKTWRLVPNPRTLFHKRLRGSSCPCSCQTLLNRHGISSTPHFLPTSQRASNPGLPPRNRQYHTPPIGTVKSQFYPTAVFTIHFPQIHILHLTIWIVKLIVVILRETVTQFTENTMCIHYKHEASGSLRTIITVSSNRQINVGKM